MNTLKRFLTLPLGGVGDIQTVGGGSGGSGSGTVTSVSVTTANGVSGVVATATSTPAITLTLGAITPTTVNKITITAPATGATLTIIDGTTLTGPAASGTAMTLGNAETVTGVKTFGTIGGAVGKLILAGSTSGSSILNAAAVAGSTTLTLPAITGTLIVGGTTANTATDLYLSATTNHGYSLTSDGNCAINLAGSNVIGFYCTAYMAQFSNLLAQWSDGTNHQFATGTGSKIGTATGQKIGFWNATPVVQQVLATGAGNLPDNIITFLQTIGLCKQS